MKLSLLQLLLPSSLLLSTASAVLHIPFERRIDDVVTPPGEASLSNPENVYFAVLRLGSDKTHAYVRIDTGSSDLWVPSSDASPCQNGGCEKSSCECHLHRSWFCSTQNGGLTIARSRPEFLQLL